MYSVLITFLHIAEKWIPFPADPDQENKGL